MTLQFIVFSRKRPLQLHGYLISLFAHIPDEVAVNVILRIDPEYSLAYNQIRERFPYVHFVEETDFQSDIISLLKRTSSDLVSFGCDDVVFTGQVQPGHIKTAFELDTIGVSLRLGRNINTGMFGSEMLKPLIFSVDQYRFLFWRVDHTLTKDDWRYPWEVLGTIYPIDFVIDMVNSIKFNNPSQLEEQGSLCWSSKTSKSLMACYPTSRIVVPTVNLIQTEFPGNGIMGEFTLSPEFLLDCWNNGLRMDTAAFAAHSHASWRIPEFYLKRG